MYFKYDTLPKSYFTQERCLPVEFKEEITGNDFELGYCTCYTQPLRYYYYDSNSDELYYQHILKSSYGSSFLTPRKKVLGKLLKAHESNMVKSCKPFKPFNGWRMIFPLENNIYLLFNFEKSYLACFDILMGKLGIENYQIYRAKPSDQFDDTDPLEYLLKFNNTADESQFILYFNGMIGGIKGTKYWDKTILHSQLIRYPILRKVWINGISMAGQNIIIR